MPEHNCVPRPSLVNALDYLAAEGAYKPAGRANHGGVSGGLRAAQAVKPLLTTREVTPIPEGVAVPNIRQFMREDATFEPDRAG